MKTAALYSPERALKGLYSHFIAMFLYLFTACVEILLPTQKVQQQHSVVGLCISDKPAVFSLAGYKNRALICVCHCNLRDAQFSNSARRRVDCCELSLPPTAFPSAPLPFTKENSLFSHKHKTHMNPAENQD